jgi:hypothetical protein
VAGRNDRAPDPLGKRALFWVPPGGVNTPEQQVVPQSTMGHAVGKHALYSEARPDPDSLAATSENPLASRGAFRVECERCHQTSYVGALDLLIFQFPIGVWLPRGRFDHRMTCPTCRRRAWCGVSLRRS